jgi:hypothetical protein
VWEAVLQVVPDLRTASRPGVEVPAGVAFPAFVFGGGDQIGDEALVRAFLDRKSVV